MPSESAHQVRCSTAEDNDEEPTPVVIVEGFLGGSLGALLWGKHEEHLNLGLESRGNEEVGRATRKRRSIFVSVGPVSSLHDRACELYYALVGGRVDYGEEHAALHNHARYGREHSQGLYPQWSSKNPLHFLGHSIGAPTVIKLQYLLSTDHFGDRTHPDMILSFTSICAPFRGTPFVYILGERVDAAPAVRALSVGSMLAKAVHILSYFAPLLPTVLDTHAESRSLSYHQAPFLSMLKQLWRSDWAESEDAAPYDVSFAAVDRREARGEGIANPRTYYSSYVCSLRSPSPLPSSSLSKCAKFLLHLPFRFSHTIIHSFNFASIHPAPSFLDTLAPGQEGSLRGRVITFTSLSGEMKSLTTSKIAMALSLSFRNGTLFLACRLTAGTITLHLFPKRPLFNPVCGTFDYLRVPIIFLWHRCGREPSLSENFGGRTEPG